MHQPTDIYILLHERFIKEEFDSWHDSPQSNSIIHTKETFPGTELRITLERHPHSSNASLKLTSTTGLGIGFKYDFKTTKSVFFIKSLVDTERMIRHTSQAFQPFKNDSSLEKNQDGSFDPFFMIALTLKEWVLRYDTNLLWLDNTADVMVRKARTE